MNSGRAGQRIFRRNCLLRAAVAAFGGHDRPGNFLHTRTDYGFILLGVFLLSGTVLMMAGNMLWK